MNLIPTLKNEQIWLRPFRPADAAPLCTIQQLPGVLRYFPDLNPPPLERVERFVAYQEKHWDQYGYGNWAITLPGSDELVGWAGLQYLKETDETEVGYLLAPDFWGRGLASAAAWSAVCFGFDHFNFDEMIALVHPDNGASLRVAAKCGFVGIERKVYWGMEMVRHSLTRSAYEQRKRELVSGGL